MQRFSLARAHSSQPPTALLPGPLTLRIKIFFLVLNLRRYYYTFMQACRSLNPTTTPLLPAAPPRNDRGVEGGWSPLLSAPSSRIFFLRPILSNIILFVIRCWPPSLRSHGVAGYDSQSDSFRAELRIKKGNISIASFCNSL